MTVSHIAWALQMCADVYSAFLHIFVWQFNWVAVNLAVRLLSLMLRWYAVSFGKPQYFRKHRFLLTEVLGLGKKRITIPRNARALVLQCTLIFWSNPGEGANFLAITSGTLCWSSFFHSWYPMSEWLFTYAVPEGESSEECKTTLSKHWLALCSAVNIITWHILDRGIFIVNVFYYNLNTVAHCLLSSPSLLPFAY